MKSVLRRATVSGSIGLLLSVGLVAFSATSASALTTPTGGPRWFIGHVETDRGNGAEIPFPMMQDISNYFNQAGLYGCALNTDNATCNDAGDVSTTDTVDNYDHDEQDQSVVLAQTSGALPQLCGTSPTSISIDYVRAIQATTTSTTCAGLVGEGYAKDSVVDETFPTIDPATYGATILYNGVQVPAGNPAAGWRPNGCGVNVCDPTVNTGTPFTNLTNNDNGGGVNSTAYRLYCATGSTRITDWGQLTDPSEPVGQGAAIGMPINLFAVTPTAGTFKTLQTFASSGVTSPTCNANANTTADTIGSPLLASDAAQISIVTAASNGGNTAGQALEMAEGLYFESNGIYNTNPYRSSVSITSGGTTTTFAASKTQMNGVSAGTLSELNGTIPTVLFISNFYLTSSLRASTASFLNWICDNSDADKGTDLLTGLNYNDELSTTISTQFGDPRVSCPLITTVANTGS